MPNYMNGNHKFVLNDVSQFYTNRDVSLKCIKVWLNYINCKDNYIIEPSAGEGAFSDYFCENNYNIDSYPKYENEFEYIFLDALSFIRLKIFNHPIEKFASELIKLSDMEGIQAIIPFSINIE